LHYGTWSDLASEPKQGNHCIHKASRDTNRLAQLLRQIQPQQNHDSAKQLKEFTKTQNTLYVNLL